MTRERLAVALAALLVASLAAPGALATTRSPTTDMTTPTTCGTEVAHDAFLDDQATIEEFNDSGSAANIESNTRVTIAETSSFYRVKAENPNSYCVHMTVSVSPEILPPTNLGNVSSNNDVTTAEWADELDFDRQQAHTEIRFVASPNSTVLFAPSKPTVLIPAWRDEKKHEAQGVIGSIRDRLSDDEPLEKRTYEFSANGSPHVTIPLRNNESDGGDQRISEWRAVYRTNPDEPWAPVDTESDAPVFYQEVADGEKVRFHFDDPDATVKFTANPTRWDTVVWDARSFKRSLHDLRDYLPFTVLPAEVTR